MPLDFILLTGDKVFFDPAFGPAIVTDLKTGTLNGSAGISYNNKKICIEDDEKKVMVSGCPYTSGPYSIPGTGTLKIDSLMPDQKAKKNKYDNKSILLKGNKFNAVFEVMAPAQMPPPASTPDSMTKYMGGTGNFVTTNTEYKAE